VLFFVRRFIATGGNARGKMLYISLFSQTCHIYCSPLSFFGRCKWHYLSMGLGCLYVDGMVWHGMAATYQPPFGHGHGQAYDIHLQSRIIESIYLSIYLSTYHPINYPSTCVRARIHRDRFYALLLVLGLRKREFGMALHYFTRLLIGLLGTCALITRPLFFIIGDFVVILTRPLVLWKGAGSRKCWKGMLDGCLILSSTSQLPTGRSGLLSHGGGGVFMVYESAGVGR